MDIFIFTTFRFKINFSLLATFLLFFPSQSFAHCAMCKTAIEQASNGNSINYFFFAALFLFIPALVLFFLMLGIIYKYR